MKFPTELKYTKEHEWIRMNDDGTATIGITDYAQSELGDIVYVEVDTIDEELGVNETFGIVEAVKTTSDLYMPVAGKVAEFNEALEDNPELVNSDPYGEGWIVKVEVDTSQEQEGLMDAASYEKEIS